LNSGDFHALGLKVARDAWAMEGILRVVMSQTDGDTSEDNRCAKYAQLIGARQIKVLRLVGSKLP
jgi:hypothetical protein